MTATGRSSVRIDRVVAEDWKRLRDLRLRALLDAPDAFGSTHEREKAEDESGWRSWITGWEGGADQAVFVAVDGGAWIGMAMGFVPPDAAATPMLFAMWVEPARRGEGVGAALVGAVVRWAGSVGATELRLRVTEINASAIRFYEGNGFTRSGERDPLRDGSDLWTLTMARRIGHEP